MVSRFIDVDLDFITVVAPQKDKKDITPDQKKPIVKSPNKSNVKSL